MKQNHWSAWPGLCNWCGLSLAPWPGGLWTYFLTHRNGSLNIAHSPLMTLAWGLWGVVTIEDTVVNITRNNPKILPRKLWKSYKKLLGRNY
jgi:hypothetical protein